MFFIFFTLTSYALALIFSCATHALAATHAPATSLALALIFFASLAPASTRLSPWYLI